MTADVNARGLQGRSLELLNKVAGDDAQFAMQHRIFNCAIAVSLATLAPASLYVLLIQQQWLVALGLFVCSLAYGWIYYLCRFADQLQKAVLVFSIVGTSLLNVMWVLDRGALGSTGYFVFIVLFIVVFTAARPVRYVVAVLANLLVINLLQEPIQAQINWQLPHSPAAQFATLVNALLYMAILAVMYRNQISKRSRERLETIVRQLQQESRQMNQVADGLVHAGDDLSAAALSQKSAVEQLLATTEELSATAEQNSQQAGDSLHALRQVEQQLTQSNRNAEQLSASINDIRRSSIEIQNINNVINDIAGQTNLLSLNAMIEASRAGDSQGGFKVVALEVKKLAERSAEAADNINRLLVANLRSVENGVTLSEDMQQQFVAVQRQLQPLAAAVHSMSESSREQADAIVQISRGLVDIDQSVGRNSQAAGQTAQTAAELRSNATLLLQVVDVLDEEL